MSKKAKKVKITPQNAGEKEKFNFKPWLIGLGVILLILGIVFVVDFFEDYHHVRKLKFDTSTGELVDKKNDITYIEAPGCYEPVLISKYAYAKDGNREYYQIAYLDENGDEQFIETSKMLSTSKEEGLYIYYNPDEYEFPSLEEFKATSFLICDTTYKTVFDNTVSRNETIASAEARRLTVAALEGEKASLTSADDVFVMRLKSPDFPYLVYCFNFYHKDGELYISDMADNRIIKLSENVLQKDTVEQISLYFSGEETE